MEMSMMSNYAISLPDESRVEEECFEDQYHPLLNHLILENVFEHLRGQNLKACRAVCNKWNEASIPFIRSKCHFTTLHQGNFEKFVDCWRHNKFGIPFGKYLFVSLSLRDEIGQEFLSLCGDSIKEMSLLFCDQVLTVQDVSEILRSTPNLESFYIPGILHSNSVNIVKLFQEDIKPKLNSLKKLRVHFACPKKPINCPTFLEEIITVAENICDLRVEGVYTWTDEDGNTHYPSLEVLGLIEKIGRESSIKTLDLTNVTSQHVELLRKMAQNGLKLKRFTFTSEKKIDGFQAIYLFKDALKSLNINTGANSMDFPNMPRLSELRFQIKKDFNFRRVNLKNIFPVLETFYIWVVGARTNLFEDVDEFFPDSDPCPTIKSLKLPHLPLTSYAFNNLRRIFSNLTELDLHVTRKHGVEILRNLWTHMTELKILSLTGEVGTKEDLDSIFTGIPTDVIQELQDTQEMTHLEKMTIECRRDTIEKMRKQHCQFPSITNLTNI